MKPVFDPEVLHAIARAHLDLPLAPMLDAIAAELAESYPGMIDTHPLWFFNNAGGAMGQVAILHASFTEYVIFFGTPIGSEGHTGRYSFVDDHAFVLQGEIWYYGEGQLERDVYHAGDRIHLAKGEAKGYRMVERAWILEYARGPIPLMLPFGLADTLLSTLDFTTLGRTFKIYARQLARTHFHNNRGMSNRGTRSQ